MTKAEGRKHIFPQSLLPVIFIWNKWIIDFIHSSCFKPASFRSWCLNLLLQFLPLNTYQHLRFEMNVWFLWGDSFTVSCHRGECREEALCLENIFSSDSYSIETVWTNIWRLQWFAGSAPSSESVSSDKQTQRWDSQWYHRVELSTPI